MKTVFLFVDKPTFIGDLLKTQYLSYLASKFKVVVFTNHANDETASDFGYRKHSNISYIRWQIRNQKLLDIMKFLRFSCTREFDHLTTTRHLRNRRGQDGSKTLLRIISAPFGWLITSRFLYKIESFLVKGLPEFLNYTKQYKPDLVLTSTPGLNNFEAEAILLSNKAGIPTVAVNCGWDNLTTRSTRVRPTKYLIAWHEPMRQEAIRIHNFLPDRVFVSGPMRYDYYVTKEEKAITRGNFLRSKNLNPKYKTILYTTQKNHFFEEAFIHQLIDLRDESKIPYTNILIRVHPLASPNRYKKFSDIKDVYLDRPEKMLSDDDLVNLKYLISYSDLNINYSSTISLEAMLFDKPVINYYEPSLKSFELNHYFPLVEAKAVQLINNGKLELAEAINEYLDNPDKDAEKRKNWPLFISPSGTVFPTSETLIY